MSFASQVTAAFTAVATDVKRLRTYITGTSTGDLTGLNTTSKTSLISAINEVKASGGGAIAGTKASALTAAAALTGSEVFAAVQGGSSVKVTAAQINAYAEPLCNAAIASVTGYAADTYVVGSNVVVPTARIQAKSIYRFKMNISKTAAGVATPIVIVRYGTAGSTADAALATLTHAVQTAVIDQGMLEVVVIFRVVGGSAVISVTSTLTHTKSITGLSTDVSGTRQVTSATFNSAVAGSIIGVSVNGGAAAAWTTDNVTAELINLV